MLDHLVFAVRDLDTAVRDLAERLGIHPSPGGQHLGFGTRNYLLSLGVETYLEIIGPDPEQPDPEGRRPLGVDIVQQPSLVAWAVKATDIEQQVKCARARGYDPGAVRSMSRTLPDGSTLGMRRTTFPEDETLPNPVPFLIDWESTAHPSATSSQGLRLLEFRAEVPDPKEVEAKLTALGVDLRLSEGKANELIATVEGPLGVVRL